MNIAHSKMKKPAKLVQYDACIQEAQNYELDIDDVLGSDIHAIVMAHALAVGCPPEFILFPLMTAVAHFMGCGTKVMVNPEWKEPVIVWFAVAARKGEKKTPALNRIIEAVTKMEDTVQAQWIIGNPDESLKAMPQIMIDYFSFEELHEVLKANNGQILGLYGEFMSLIEQLDIYKPSASSLDRKTFLSLNGGSKWRRNFQNKEPSSLPMTHCNFAGMVQPRFIMNLMERDDLDGMMDRILVVCPKEAVYYAADYKVPMPENIPDFVDIFSYVRDRHPKGHVYTLSQEAKEVFDNCHDRLLHEKLQYQDEDHRSVLSKAQGQTIRIAAIVHALTSATTSMARGEDDMIPNMIGPDAVTSAFKIMDHVIRQRFAMISPVQQAASTNTVRIEIDQDLHVDAFVETAHTKIHKFLLHPGPSITPSVAARYRLFPPLPLTHGNTIQYPSNAAIPFMKRVSQLGFGILSEITGKRSRNTHVFEKTHPSDLDDRSKKVMRYLHVTEQQYAHAFGVDEPVVVPVVVHAHAVADPTDESHHTHKRARPLKEEYDSDDDVYPTPLRRSPSLLLPLRCTPKSGQQHQY